MNLGLLEPQSRSLLSEQCLAGEVSVDFGKHMKAFHRNVELDALSGVLSKAKEVFHDDPPASDSWLAARIHATLRLSRREAADDRLWDFLAVIAQPDFVRWRWSRQEQRINSSRFIGPEYKQTFARLWWGAELTRNAEDYSATSQFFVNQDFQNSWARLDLFHHKPTSLAAVKFLATFNDGKMATSDQIRQLVAGFNMVLTTTMLDSVVLSPPVDVEAVQEWCQAQVGSADYLTTEPEGPRESKIRDESIDSIVDVLRHAATVTTFFKRDRTRKAG